MEAVFWFADLPSGQLEMGGYPWEWIPARRGSSLHPGCYRIERSKWVAPLGRPCHLM